MKAQERDTLLQALKDRFEKVMHRHKGIAWAEVQARLDRNPNVLTSLRAMEATGGEPDVIGQDKDAGSFTFCDCSAQSPIGRRSVCYDREALKARKTHKPHSSAVEMAAEMGIDLLTEEQYRQLQQLGEFDTKTSSWVKTPSDVRSLGGSRVRAEPSGDRVGKTSTCMWIVSRNSVETTALLAGLGERPVASPIGAAELR